MFLAEVRSIPDDDASKVDESYIKMQHLDSIMVVWVIAVGGSAVILGLECLSLVFKNCYKILIL